MRKLKSRAFFPKEIDHVSNAFLFFNCQAVPPDFELIGKEHLDHNLTIA